LRSKRQKTQHTKHTRDKIKLTGDIAWRHNHLALMEQQLLVFLDERQEKKNMRAKTRFNYRLLIDWYRILLYIIITFMLKSLFGGVLLAIEFLRLTSIKYFACCPRNLIFLFNVLPFIFIYFPPQRSALSTFIAKLRSHEEN
jgi:hypothetical protein